MSDSAIDVGVRALVAWLNAEGFTTTDSGDGVSKTEMIATGCALTYPHVFMSVDTDRLTFEANRLKFALARRGVVLEPMGTEAPCCQASYDPVNDSAVLMLLHVDDFVLGGARRA